MRGEEETKAHVWSICGETPWFWMASVSEIELEGEAVLIVPEKLVSGFEVENVVSVVEEGLVLSVLLVLALLN